PDQVRTRVPVCLGVDNQNGFPHLGFHGTVTRERTDRTVEHNVGGGQCTHRFDGVCVTFAQGSVVFVVTVLIFGNVEVELANGVGPVVAQRVSCRVFQAVTRQHHNRAAHAGNNVPGHHSFWRAVVYEHPCTVSLEAHGRFLTRVYIRQLGATQCTRGRVQIDV